MYDFLNAISCPAVLSHLFFDRLAVGFRRSGSPKAEARIVICLVSRGAIITPVRELRSPGSGVDDGDIFVARTKGSIWRRCRCRLVVFIGFDTDRERIARPTGDMGGGGKRVRQRCAVAWIAGARMEWGGGGRRFHAPYNTLDPDHADGRRARRLGLI